MDQKEDKVLEISNKNEVYSFSANTLNPSSIKITAVIASIANKIGVPPNDIVKEVQEKAKTYPIKVPKIYVRVESTAPKKFELSFYVTKTLKINEIIGSSKDHSTLLYEYAQELVDLETKNKVLDSEERKQKVLKTYKQLVGQYNSNTSKISKKLQ